MRDLGRDLRNALYAIGAGFLLYFVLWGGLPGSIGFALGRWSKSAKVDTLRVEIHTADTTYVTRTDTVTKVQRRVDTVKARSDALDSAVVIASDSTVVITDTVIVVPPLVVADLRALRLTVATQDTLIRALYQRDTTQQWRIASRDKLIGELSRKHPLACGRKCGFVIGVASVIALRKALK